MKAENINLAFGNEVIYENVSFHISELSKVGIVGVNGAGKTTLFNVLLKKIPLDSGKIQMPKNTRIGYLPQVIVMEDQELTVLEYLLAGRPIQKLEEKLTKLYEEVAVATGKEQEKKLKEIGETQEKLEYYDCYNAENTLFEIIDNMKIDSTLLDMQLKNLSGGQKSKIAFAHLIYSNPEIMLLDEPTNHLDKETRNYIIDYLKKYRGTVLVISHDIEFLNKIINQILYLDKTIHKMKIYNGNYEIFQKRLKEEKEEKERLIKIQEKEEEKLKNVVLLYSNSSGNRKKMAQSREKTLEKLQSQKIERDITYKTVKLKIKPEREGSKIPVKVNNIDFNYPDKDRIINNLSFIINKNERFLIVGKNGVGKSTLLKLLVGELKAKNGNIWFGSKTDIAYYAQEQELLDQTKTVLENINAKGYSEKELRTILGNFLFFNDDVFKKVSVLSPGEKARLSLAKIILKKANLIILDEPTNHLDPETQKIIGENFRNYEGTIILVSHNPSFVESINVDRMLILPKGKITNYSKEKLLEYHENNA